MVAPDVNNLFQPFPRNVARLWIQAVSGCTTRLKNPEDAISRPGLCDVYFTVQVPVPSIEFLVMETVAILEVGEIDLLRVIHGFVISAI